MIGLLLAATMGWFFFSSYIVSTYALAVYIDPEEVATLLPGASPRRRAALTKLAQDPLAFYQVATMYRVLAVIAVTVAMLHLTELLSPTLQSGYLDLVGLATVWMLFLFFTEYLPRRSSRHAVNRRMVRYLWLIVALHVLLKPVIGLYRQALKRGGQDRPVTEEEKEEIVERAIETLAEQAGIGESIVEEDEKEMIGQIFLLDQTLVREIMTPRIDLLAIEKATPFGDIQKMVRRDGHSRYPVFDTAIDKIIGLLYVKDLFSKMPRPGEGFVIGDYLREPFFVPETKVIGELLREFKDRELHLAIVVDEYGGVAGLVTMEDILEEIVGEIRDEHDSEEDEFKRLADGWSLVDAALRLDRLQDILGTDYQQSDTDTVGGLIYDLVGSVPDEGEVVHWHDLEFKVFKVDGQRIKSVKLIRRQSG